MRSDKHHQTIRFMFGPKHDLQHFDHLKQVQDWPKGSQASPTNKFGLILTWSTLCMFNHEFLGYQMYEFGLLKSDLLIAHLIVKVNFFFKILHQGGMYWALGKGGHF